MENDPTTELRDVMRGIPEKLSSLRQKLGQKAKQEPKFRFYALYDRIYRQDTLLTAWYLLRKDASPGIDGITFEQIEQSAEGVAGFLKDLQEDLRTKRYRPGPVKRKYIRKENGKMRPLGIPTIRDRVAQMATILILEPIFEEDFEECSYGFRPGRSAHQALEEIYRHLQVGFREVYDADLQGYFDSIPHDKLMACIRMRVVDRSVLHLIRLWLEAVVVDEDEDKKTPGKRSEQGTPQGGVISPLLANVFLNWFDKRFHRAEGPAQFANAKLVRYADDFVVLARYQGIRIIRWIENTLENWMGLKINREKTRVVNLCQEGTSLDFLGYRFGYEQDRYGREHKYLHWGPSPKAVKKECEKVRTLTDKDKGWLPITLLIGRLSGHLRGWANYFGRGYPRRAFRKINGYVLERLYRHLRRRSQRPFRPPEGTSWWGALADYGYRPL